MLFRNFILLYLVINLLVLNSCKIEECKIDEKELEKTCVNIDWNKNYKQQTDALILPVYMDYQATTKVDPRVLEEMYFVEKNYYGNANSLHKMGREAMKLVEKARKQVADVINAKPNEIIFTSGATESNNLALKGVVEKYSKQTGKKHIITSMTEHACILESCKSCEKNDDIEITYLVPRQDGLIDLKEIEDSIRPDTLMISIMGVNNEIGVIQDLEKIGKIAKKHNVLFHTDCAQAFGKIPLDVDKMGIDLMSISSHKIYGPKGIGALYVRQKPKVRLSPIIHGGGQEKGLRSGTLATPLCVGFGLAGEIIQNEMAKDNTHIQKLSDKFLDSILQLDDVYLNGNRKHKIPGCNNVSFLHIEGESLLLAIPDMCVSTGSACNSANLQPSYVISKMRKNDYYAHSAIRFGFGRFTTEKEVDILIDELISAVNHLRKISPLWEMKQNGIDISKINWDNT